MNADEIVKALKEVLPPQVDYAELVGSPVPSSYGVCYVWEDPEPYHISAAIDLIESLQAQLVKEEERRRTQADRIREERSQKYECFDVISDLKKQLSASQRKERAAVDLIPHECGVSCKHYNDGDPAPWETYPCSECLKPNYSGGIYCSGEKFEWRGPQEAGKGETK